jgi:hypothetical protein
MKTEDVALQKEGAAEGYLGIYIQRHENQITFTQIGLTKRIIDSLGLDSKYTTVFATPAEKAALGRNVNDSPASGQINYASVIGMLLYLGHSHPNIAFATHQCACYTFAPKQLHEDALKLIGRYLKGTLDKGLILCPTDELRLIVILTLTLLVSEIETTRMIHIVFKAGQDTSYVSQIVQFCGLVSSRLKLHYL